MSNSKIPPTPPGLTGIDRGTVPGWHKAQVIGRFMEVDGNIEWSANAPALDAFYRVAFHGSVSELEAFVPAHPNDPSFVHDPMGAPLKATNFWVYNSRTGLFSEAIPLRPEMIGASALWG